MDKDLGRIGDADRAFAASAIEPVSRLDPDGLQSLALRCEQAAGPDRALDVAILVAIDWREPDWEEGERTVKEMVDLHGLAWLVGRIDQGMSIWRHLPRLTASLDAAMTLVPEGARRVEFGTYHGGGAWAYVDTLSDSLGEAEYAATEPLALCAAALRAQAMSAGTVKTEGLGAEGTPARS